MVFAIVTTNGSSTFIHVLWVFTTTLVLEPASSSSFLKIEEVPQPVEKRHTFCITYPNFKTLFLLKFQLRHTYVDTYVDNKINIKMTEQSEGIPSVWHDCT